MNSHESNAPRFYLAVITTFAIVPGEPRVIGGEERTEDESAAFNAGSVASHIADGVKRECDEAGTPCVAVGAREVALHPIGDAASLPLWNWGD